MNEVATQTDFESGFDKSAYDFSVDEFYKRLFEMTNSLVSVSDDQGPALFATTASMMCLAAGKAVEMFRAENPDTLLTAGDMANVAAMRASTVNLLERIVDRIAPGYEPEPWEKKLAKDPLWKDDPVKNAADLLTGFRYLDRLVGDDVFGLARLNMIIDAAYKLGAARVSAGARVERSKRAKFESTKLLSVVTVVLDNNPGLKPQVKVIRPKVLETMGLPGDAASPSIKAVREALCVINRQRAPKKTAAL